jgi:hypothetical protein
MGTSPVTTPKQGGFEVVIIYAQPEDGCPAPKECTSADLFVSTASDVTTLLTPSAISSLLERPVSDTSSPAQTPPSASFQKPAPINSSPVEKPAFSQSATTVKLPPSVHWTVDTSSPANIIPVPAHSGSPMYYGQSGELHLLILQRNRATLPDICNIRSISSRVLCILDLQFHVSIRQLGSLRLHRCYLHPDRLQGVV